MTGHTEPCTSSRPTFAAMSWPPLTALDELDAIDAASAHRPVLLFKHSTRCSISGTALHRLQRAWQVADGPTYLLDLLRHRALSDAIAQRYGVRHESPQVLVIHQGRCIRHTSHLAITYLELAAAMRG